MEIDEIPDLIEKIKTIAARNNLRISDVTALKKYGEGLDAPNLDEIIQDLKIEANSFNIHFGDYVRLKTLFTGWDMSLAIAQVKVLAHQHNLHIHEFVKYMS